MSSEEKGEFELGDPEVSDGFKSSNNRYQAKAGKKDLVRIITKFKRYYSHQLPYKPYYITCNKANGDCPACDKKVPRAQKVACLLVHIGRKSVGDEKFEPVGKVKPWLFSKKRWNALCNILDDYPQVREAKIQTADLIFTCMSPEDEEFQAIEISPTLQDSQATKGMMENLDEARDNLNFYIGSVSADVQRKILRNYNSDKVEQKKSSPEKSSESVNLSDAKEAPVSAEQISDIMDGGEPLEL